MATEKVRVYDLAKQLKLSNSEVIDLLDKKLNIKVKSHSSTITNKEAEKLSAAVKGKAETTPKAPVKPSKTAQPKIAKEAPKQESAPVEKKENVEKKQEKAEERPAHAQTARPEFKDRGARPFDRNRMGDQRPRERQEGFQRRPEGQQRPFQRNGEGQKVYQRPHDRPYQRPQEGRPPYQRDGRPFQRTDRPPYQRDGNRPFQRPGAPGQRPERPAGERGPRPEGSPRPPFPTRKPVVSREKPGEIARPDAGKAPSRREIFNKKKDKYKSDFKTKEEKLEQAKLLQEKFKKKQKPVVEKEKVTQITLDKPLTVGELATKLDIGAGEVVKQLMMAGVLATVNQTIDVATAKKVAEALEITVVEEEIKAEEAKEEKPEIKEDESKLEHRAPVVTIMGHVDHGKTTLLDAIRAQKHKIVNTEVGGITQSIGAYTVKIDGKKIVFIDTPGHEAFTAMRARGAETTDIAILVVAADDGIMPQTIESINHAKAAKVPIIIAVNKIDKADADPDKVLQQLTEYDLVAEKWGGDTICVPVSALQGTNLDELLEYILLVAEIENLKANPNKDASGVVIEARLDKGKGPVATLLVQSGTLKVGDCIVIGTVGGKVRALLSDEGERLTKAGPSTPVEIIGLSEVPQAGDRFEIAACERDMKAIVAERKEEERETRLEAIAPAQIRKELILKDQEQAKDLNIIIKANTHGSAEAVSAALQQLKSKSIFVKVVHVGIGDISEADVMLASASNAIILGFSVKEDGNALRVAASEGIDIRKYDIIYQILEDIEKTMLGLLQPEIKEVSLGTAEVRQVFTVGKTTKIAGCYVLDGKVIRNKTASVQRNGKEIFKGNIDQLKRFKDDAKEVASGFECGISFNKFNDIQEGDIIKVFTTEEIERESLV